MKLSRTLKRWISLALVGLVFFAQMATAAYVCPQQSGVQLGQQQAVSNPTPGMADMLGCNGVDAAAMDAEAPGLCHASCSAADQSERTPTPKMPVATLHSVPFVVLPTVPVAMSQRAVLAPPTQSVPASPPLSVLYCCFRI